MSTTADPSDPRLGRGVDSEPGPQNDVYLVLSDEERAKGYVRPLRRAYVHHLGCGALTVMSMDIAATYARQPTFYGATYCSGCQKHLPLEEFIWDGTREVVGS